MCVHVSVGLKFWSEAFTLDGKVPLVGSNDGSCACEELGALGAAMISLLWA